MTRLTVATFKWRKEGFRSTYEAGHVNRLAAMFRKYLSLPHDFVCITDDARGLDSEIRAVELWPDCADLLSPHDKTGRLEPSCYRRLKLYCRSSAALVGERILQCDLDTVITGELAPLVDRPEDTVLLATRHPHIPFNGSLQLITPGAQQSVWDDFDPETSPQAAYKKDCYGSDQAWLSYCLKGKVATWNGESDGIYAFNALEQSRMRGQLPADARMVLFFGARDPWGSPQRHEWVRRYYPLPLTRPLEEAA